MRLKFPALLDAARRIDRQAQPIRRAEDEPVLRTERFHLPCGVCRSSVTVDAQMDAKGRVAGDVTIIECSSFCGGDHHEPAIEIEAIEQVYADERRGGVA